MSALWQLWRDSEGTKLVIEGLKQRREAYKNALADGDIGFRTVEATALKYAEIVGRVNEIDQLISLMMESEDNDEDSGTREEG